MLVYQRVSIRNAQQNHLTVEALHLDRAEKWLRDMPNHGLQPDDVTYSTVRHVLVAGTQVFQRTRKDSNDSNLPGNLQLTKVTQTTRKPEML